jgi:3-mercaptopyruvate sulfurtransferase SseA
MALENGAMGWRLAGGDLASGPDGNSRPDVGVEARRRAADRAARLAREHSIHLIDERTLAEYRADGHRSTYLFDVRGPEAYATGHRVEFRSVAGSEAILTGYWLAQMGFEVSVLRHGLTGQYLVTDTEEDFLVEPAVTEPVSWHAVGPELGAGTVVIDCSSSRRYRDGHIPGSHHCVRSELAAGLEQVAADRLLFTSDDGDLARFAAADAFRLGRPSAHLIGGNAAWLAAGQELTSESVSYLVEPGDIWAKPYETSTDDPDSMRRYLEWEIALLDSVDLSQLTALRSG